MKEIIETWNINSRINMYLLGAITENYLLDIHYSKGRSVGEQFGHINNVRLMWLKAASPELFEGQNKIEKNIKITKELLASELNKSAEAIAKLL